MNILNNEKKQQRQSLSLFLMTATKVYKHFNKKENFKPLLDADSIIEKGGKMSLKKLETFSTCVIEVRDFCFKKLEEEASTKGYDLGCLFLDYEIYFSLLGVFPSHIERLCCSKIEVIQAVTNYLLEVLDSHEMTSKKFVKRMNRLLKEMLS